MNQLFENLDVRKVDTNTRKEMDEPGWRKLDSEESKVYATYYLYNGIPQKRYIFLRVVALLILFVSVGELLFEQLCREDPSFNPLPMWGGIIFGVILLLLNECILLLTRRSAFQDIRDNVYVVDAMAYNYVDNKVQIMVNHKKLAFDKYVFRQVVSPMDYEYDEHGKKNGFYVRMFLILKDGRCMRKDVLGSEEYQYYNNKYQKMKKHQRWIALFNI